MKVKVGDKVLVIAGKDKGKEGKITKTFKKEDRVIVEGINIVKKHQKPTNTNESGGILERENPIHVSNVKKITSDNKETKKPTAKVKEEKTVKKTTAKKEKKAN